MSELLSSVPLGARYMILSAAGFACMGMCVKLAHADGIPILEIVAARSLISGVISWADVRRKGISLLGNQRGLLFARGLVGAVALICVYYAVVHLPFATATLLQYLHPMFTAVLAALFLRERLQMPTLVCILLSLLGLLTIVRPGPEALSAGYPPLAITAAIVGALGSSVAYVFVRRLSRSEDPSVIIFYFPIITLPIALVLLGNDAVMPEGVTWLTLLGVGVSTQIGQIGLTKAMQTETAGRATSFSYLQVVFAAIIGWWVFAEMPDLWTWIGGGLIVLGALVNIFWKPQANR